MEVINLNKYKQLVELLEMLKDTTLSSSDISLLLDTLHEGKTLASSLRTVGITSPYELPESVWVQLRPWRNEHFPQVAIDPLKD